MNRRQFLRSAASLAIAQAFPLPVLPKTVNIPTLCSWRSTTTGRWSCSNPDIQNLRNVPKRIVVWDSLASLNYDELELRVLTHG